MVPTPTCNDFLHVAHKKVIKVTPAEKIKTELSNYRYYKNKFGETHPRTMDKLLEIANLIPREWTTDKDTALSKFVASAQRISDLRKKNE